MKIIWEFLLGAGIATIIMFGGGVLLVIYWGILPIWLSGTIFLILIGYVIFVFGKKTGEEEYKSKNEETEGVIHFPGGLWYEGTYNKDDKPNGQGTFTFPNDEKMVGEWKNGDLWEGIKYDKDGNIKYKVVNGEPQLLPLKPTPTKNTTK